MSPRPYRLGRREASVVQTRARIFAAAQTLLGTAGFHQISVEAIARQADVSRKTVYYHFGSKRGLIDAVVTDLEQQAEVVARVRAIVEQPDVGHALPAYMREVCRFWTSAQGVIRSLSALAALDREVAEVLGEHDAARRRRLVAFVARLAEQERMPAEASPERIVDTLWMLSSFGTFDHLVQRSEIPPDEAADILVTLAQSLLAN